MGTLSLLPFEREKKKKKKNVGRVTRLTTPDCTPLALVSRKLTARFRYNFDSYACTTHHSSILSFVELRAVVSKI